jgi:hypothetical protein
VESVVKHCLLKVTSARDLGWTKQDALALALAPNAQYYAVLRASYHLPSFEPVSTHELKPLGQPFGPPYSQPGCTQRLPGCTQTLTLLRLGRRRGLGRRGRGHFESRHWRMRVEHGTPRSLLCARHRNDLVGRELPHARLLYPAGRGRATQDAGDAHSRAREWTVVGRRS